MMRDMGQLVTICSGTCTLRCGGREYQGLALCASMMGDSSSDEPQGAGHPQRPGKCVCRCSEL